MSEIGYFIEPNQLEEASDNGANLVIVDLCAEENYEQAHIPNAHWLRYATIKRVNKPIMGMLPDSDQFSEVVSALGITKSSLVVAYDNVNCGCAARFIWTLHVFGHDRAVVLNGGFNSWLHEGYNLSNTKPDKPTNSHYLLKNTHQHLATLAFIKTHLNDDNIIFLDARSLSEYTGKKARAAKKGHIPGAIHYQWTTSIDSENNSRHLPDEEIQQQLDDLGIRKDKNIICYCQSHHRSSYSWLILKHLGYRNVMGYPGSWSEWGNHPDTLVESFAVSLES